MIMNTYKKLKGRLFAKIVRWLRLLEILLIAAAPGCKLTEADIGEYKKAARGRGELVCLPRERDDQEHNIMMDGRLNRILHQISWFEEVEYKEGGE